MKARRAKGTYLISILIPFMMAFCNSDANKNSTSTQNAKPMEHTLKMPVKIAGKGQPLVLVGGGLTGWSSWEQFVDTFTAMQKKVIRVQLLNVEYGLDNRELPKNYSIKTESGALKASLDDLGLSNPLDIVAWSFGALVSLDYALDHPHRIRTLILIEPPAFWVLREENAIDSGTQHTLNFLETLQGPVTENMFASFLNEVGLVPEGQQAQDLPQWEKWLPYRHSLRNNSAILSHRDSLNRLTSLKAPVLFIKGIGSGRYYHKIEDILVSRLPHARSIEMPGAHAAHIVSRERFIRELDNFQEVE